MNKTTLMTRDELMRNYPHTFTSIYDRPSFDPTIGEQIPNVEIPIQNDEGEFEMISTHEMFADKKVILIGIPGAFTPTCSSTHLPGFELKHSEFVDNKDVDEIYVHAINDQFVMDAWFDQIGVERLKALPDGNGEFSEFLNSSVMKSNLGLGKRVWRYVLVLDNNTITHKFIEAGQENNCSTDPFEVTDAETVYDAI